VSKINSISSAEKIANWINNSERAQKVLKGINKNPAVFSAITAFAMASILRPAAIGVLPFKNKKDKKCSQASAVSAGLVELGATTAVFMPLNKVIEDTSKSLYKSTGTFYSGNNVALRQFKSVTNRGFKLLFLIPISLARFALVKPLMNKIFNNKEDVTKVAQQEEKRLDKWA
jgi:hypothetical protein